MASIVIGQAAWLAFFQRPWPYTRLGTTAVAEVSQLYKVASYLVDSDMTPTSSIPRRSY